MLFLFFPSWSECKLVEKDFTFPKHKNMGAKDDQ